MELSIDTSTTCAAVGLSDNGEFVAERRWRSRQNHCVELVPAIRELMGRAGVETSSLEAVFVARGPGGFSALRVGMSAAKALSAALDVPLVAVNTLDVEAAPYLPLGSPVAAVIPAGRNRLYLGSYGAPPDGGLASYRVIQTHELAGLLSAGDVVCGEAAEACADAAAAAGARVADASPPTRGAAALARLAYARLARGSVDDRAALQPLYLRSAQVEMARRTWGAAG